MPRFTTSSTTYGAFYAQPQAPSAGVKKPTAAIDNPYANSLTGIDAVLADRGVDPVTAMFQFCRRREAVRELKERGMIPPWTTDPVLQKGRFLNVFREDDRGTKALLKFAEPVAEDVEQLVQALFFARWCNKDATLELLGSAKALADPDAVEAALDAMAPWCNHTAYPVGAVQFEGKEWARRAFATRGLARAAPTLVAKISGAGGSVCAAVDAINDVLKMENDFPIFCAVSDLAWFRPDLIDPASPVPSGIGSAPYMDVLQRHLKCSNHDEVSQRVMAMQPELWPEARRPLQPIDVEYLACELRKYYSYILGTKDFEGKNLFTPGVNARLTVDVDGAAAAAAAGGVAPIYVIAGGPCSGKSTLCSALRAAGHATEAEVAETLLNEGIAAGRTADQIRGDEIAWQTSNLKANFARIERLRAAGTPTFVDTSFIETVVFAERCGITLGAGIEAWLRAVRYRVVFLLEPLSFEATEVRLESAAAAAEIAGAVAACYERYGYTVVRVPPLPPASRLAFVLQAAGVFPKFVQ